MTSPAEILAELSREFWKKLNKLARAHERRPAEIVAEAVDRFDPKEMTDDQLLPYVKERYRRVGTKSSGKLTADQRRKRASHAAKFRRGSTDSKNT